MSSMIKGELNKIDFHWEVMDPFIFCAHHIDDYPAGNDAMGPAASLAGRMLGEDFTVKDGWRMYHGEKIPGFPAHPHRGFETVTIVLSGFVDHSDSHGQAGRYGMGDVQWMTAGSGLQHCEMFPLLNREGRNPAELFQVWLNLPASRKFAAPHFKMLWNEKIPVFQYRDEREKVTSVKLVAGSIGDLQAPAPAPDSWAADPANHVAIWTIRMEPGASWNLPPADKKANRMIFFYRGDTIILDGTTIPAGNAAELVPDASPLIRNGNTEAFLFMLQGVPIGEPIAQYGPFVMNTETEIRQAFSDYRTTEFGGWPWPRRDYVHPREQGRFAKYLDGKTETP